MAVAPHPWEAPKLPVKSSNRRFKQRATKSTPVLPFPQRGGTSGSVLHNAASRLSAYPANRLKLFAMGQRFTQVLAGVGIATAVGLYACTVYNQRVWSYAYSTLGRLQEDERSILTNNASIKGQLIEQANQPAAGWVTLKPEHHLFVPEPKTVKLLPEVKLRLVYLDDQVPVGY